MRVQEFDNLADWFKENVLDVQSMDDESYNHEVHVESQTDLDDVDQVHPVVEKPTEAEEELSLIEYIIAIDQII